MNSAADRGHSGWSTQHSTAVHEAGHAVATWLQGRAFKFITIVPSDDEGYSALVRHKMPQWYRDHDFTYDQLTAPRRNWLESQVIITLAGEAAQRLYDTQHESELPVDYEIGTSVACQHDRQIVNEMVMQLGDAPEAELSAYLGWLAARTDTLVGRWDFRLACDALADAVQVSGTLSWRKAKPIMMEAVYAQRDIDALLARWVTSRK